jgi:hypothetical protein
MNCDICGERPQAFIISDMSNGEQKFLCPGCFARFGVDFAKAILPPEEIAEQLGPMFVTPGRQAALAKAPKSGKGRKAKANAEAEPEPEPQPQLPEVAAAAEDG